jgi:hypothetical protein
VNRHSKLFSIVKKHPDQFLIPTIIFNFCSLDLHMLINNYYLSLNSNFRGFGVLGFWGFGV